MVQWLRIHSSSAGGVGSILDWGTKIPYAIKHGQKIKKKKKTIWDCKISSKPRIKENPLWKKRTLFLTSNYFYNFSYSLSRTTPTQKEKKKGTNEIPMKIPAGIFIEIDKLILKLIWKCWKCKDVEPTK